MSQNQTLSDEDTLALAAGATGGKMLGAGGGGFLLLHVRPELQLAVKHRLARLVHVPRARGAACS